jgi:hypothetical protein
MSSSQFEIQHFSELVSAHFQNLTHDNFISNIQIQQEIQVVSEFVSAHVSNCEQ